MAHNSQSLSIDVEGRGDIQISEYPDSCPWCREKGTPDFITAHAIGAPWEYEETIEAVFKCPANKCKRYYIAYYGKPSHRISDFYILSRIDAPPYFKPIEFTEEIKKISPGFHLIYNQAAIAEETGLMQVCGCGYRKSLEFLIKDYLQVARPDKAEEIKKMPLASAIEMVDDNRVKDCAKRAAWLGNDESHYVRLWEEKDITNLKDLIQLTRFWIEGNIITEKYTSEMPQGKK